MKLRAVSLSKLSMAIGNIPVKTNWPTVAEKPDRKALNGCNYRRQQCFVDGIVMKWIRLTYIVANEQAIDELQYSHDDQEGHEYIYELRPLRGGVQVVLPYRERDVLRALVGGGFLARGNDGG